MSVRLRSAIGDMAAPDDSGLSPPLSADAPVLIDSALPVIRGARATGGRVRGQ